MKGYPRGLARGSAQTQAVTKIRLPINHSVVVSAAGAAIGFGTVVLGGLPEGHLKIMAAAVQVQFSGSGADANLTDTFDGDFGVGSTPASDATITAGDVDFISSTALGAATTEVSPLLTVADGVDLVLDNTAGALELNLNVLIDAANITDDESVTLTAEGIMEVTLITMLDA
tara:strand:+ start:8052 stop:8567 length:516 start_codon:yes stop_codon:yes gene_type:complete